MCVLGMACSTPVPAPLNISKTVPPVPPAPLPVCPHTCISAFPLQLLSASNLELATTAADVLTLLGGSCPTSVEHLSVLAVGGLTELLRECAAHAQVSVCLCVCVGSLFVGCWPQLTQLNNSTQFHSTQPHSSLKGTRQRGLPPALGCAALRAVSLHALVVEHCARSPACWPSLRPLPLPPAPIHTPTPSCSASTCCVI